MEVGIKAEIMEKYFLLVGSGYFLTQLKTTYLVVALPIEGLRLPQKSSIKEMAHKFAYSFI